MPIIDDSLWDLAPTPASNRIARHIEPIGAQVVEFVAELLLVKPLDSFAAAIAVFYAV